MSLAHRLAKALERGRHLDPVLLWGDALEGEELEAGSTPAAVLVAVLDRPEPTVILTLRPDTMRKHPGQISFPGGRIDPTDAGPIDAALREAEEEIGLDRSRVEVIGVADRYRTITGFEVTPVIGVVQPGFTPTPEPSEVAHVFEVPLAHLLDPSQQVLKTVEWRGGERSYYEITYEGHRIWGATAAMLVNLGRRLELEREAS